MRTTSPRAHRLCNVFQRLRAHIFESNVHLAADLSMSIIGNADATGLCNSLKAGSDIDAVTKNITVIENDVTDVNADAELNFDVLRYRGVLLRHTPLDLNRTTYRINSASKLDQHSIAGGLDDAAAMYGDGGIDEGLSGRLEPGKRPFFVQPH
jgi:hypothetical protein